MYTVIHLKGVYIQYVWSAVCLLCGYTTQQQNVLYIMTGIMGYCTIWNQYEKHDRHDKIDQWLSLEFAVIYCNISFQTFFLG